jgi:hypothetical protein
MNQIDGQPIIASKPARQLLSLGVLAPVLFWTAAVVGSWGNGDNATGFCPVYPIRSSPLRRIGAASISPRLVGLVCGVVAGDAQNIINKNRAVNEVEYGRIKK